MTPERIEAAVQLFAQQCRPYQYSGFGFPKRSEVNDCAKKGTLNVFEENGVVTIAAIVRALKHDQGVKDFRGETIVIPKGHVFVSDIALADAASFTDLTVFLMDVLPEENGLLDTSCHMWVEIYQEHPRLREYFEECNWYRAGTKIMAGSEIKTLYTTRKPVLPAWDDADKPVLKEIIPAFLLESELALIRKELDGYVSRSPEAWENHYSIYNEQDKWSAFAVRGYKPDDPSYIVKPSEMSKTWKASHADDLLKYTTPEWTLASVFFPGTLGLLSNLPVEFDRIRFMRLTSNGGTLERHTDITDRFAGTADGKLTRLHIPIYTNPQVMVNGWGLSGTKITQQWHAGGLFYLDQRKPHQVVNGDPTQDRVHLVFDVESSEWVRNLLR